ncbi:MAG: dihydroneopterin aldolase [Deltaproteobacteria bacterium]|nr:dihydroneopterin aldolase [Deltaproteobacteria bacterium]
MQATISGNTASDAVRINNLEVDCIIGVYPKESETPQSLVVDLDMLLDTRKAAGKEQLRYTVNYAAVTAQVAFILRHFRFRLLETAAHTLCRFLLLPPALSENRPQVERVRIRLSKPGALSNRAIPSVEIERDPSSEELERVARDFGFIDVVFEGRETGIYRIDIGPKKSFTLTARAPGRAADMVVTGGLVYQGHKLRAGTIRQRSQSESYCYDNPTDRYQTLLCVDTLPLNS